MDSLCHLWFTTTNLSYSFLFLKLPPPPCAVLLVWRELVRQSLKWRYLLNFLRLKGHNCHKNYHVATGNSSLGKMDTAPWLLGRLRTTTRHTADSWFGIIVSHVGLDIPKYGSTNWNCHFFDRTRNSKHLETIQMLGIMILLVHYSQVQWINFRENFCGEGNDE